MTISGERTEQLDILPHHWLYGWFSQFHRCGTYSVLSRIPSILNHVAQAYRPYLTLPYHTGKTFYHLALRPLTGPMRIPKLTVRLQNRQVQYSPGSILIPGTISLPRGGLLTWTYLLIAYALLESPREYQLEST